MLWIYDAKGKARLPLLVTSDDKKMSILTIIRKCVLFVVILNNRVLGQHEPKEEERMKRLVVIFVMAIFLASCGQTAIRSEFYQHDTMYKNWDHLKFSWSGQESSTAQDLEKSTDQQWWGIDVPYVPGQ